MADTMMARPKPTQKQAELDKESLIKDIEEEIRKSQGDKAADAAMARFHADPTPAWIKILGWYMGGQDNIKNIS